MRLRSAKALFYELSFLWQKGSNLIFIVPQPLKEVYFLCWMQNYVKCSQDNQETEPFQSLLRVPFWYTLIHSMCAKLMCFAGLIMLLYKNKCKNGMCQFRPLFHFLCYINNIHTILVCVNLSYSLPLKI